ncbi:glycosyltransferase family 4 protein [Pantanalinema rosaneae CENA516]|uniref:glycosyltransferase family 4 protein n=1 Tax=Pantanalinema rosaneae TaxID=1620701 RepID=UPI003D6ED752
MRILHLLNDIRELGNGIINVAIDLACLQAQAGHEVAIASAGGEYETLLATYGVKHFCLNQRRHPLNLLKATWHLQQILRNFQPEIVHAHMITGAVLAWGLKRQFSYALVSTVHNEFQRSAVLMGLADRVIAVSRAVADSMQQRGIPAHKLRVVRNGTLNSPRQRQSLVSQSLQRPAIVTIAGMYRRKGIAELIAAFSQIAEDCPTAHLYLVGDGPDRAQFTLQAQQTSVSDRIHFEGFQPEPQGYLQAADVFVLASHREPFGLVLSEAREAGCAIVASYVDGIPEALDQGHAGILIPPANVDALSRSITELLQQPELLQTWRQRSRQNLAWLQVDRVLHDTLLVYQELVDRAVALQPASEAQTMP